MRDGVYQVTQGPVCAGFIVENGQITRMAPILRAHGISGEVRRVNEFYRVLFTGSRDYADQARVRGDLEKLLKRFECRPDQVVVVQGMARGLDSIARIAALELGMRIEDHPADWNRYGKSAGHRRNAAMVASVSRRPATGRGVVAYPLGKSQGTRGCIALAERAGLKVWNRTDPPDTDPQAAPSGGE